MKQDRRSGGPAAQFKPGERSRFWKVAQFRSTSLYADLTEAELREWKMYLKLEGLAGYRLVGELIRTWLQEERDHFAALSPDGRPPHPPGAGPAAGIAEDLT